jgi:hypothetical protein
MSAKGAALQCKALCRVFDAPIEGHRIPTSRSGLLATSPSGQHSPNLDLPVSMEISLAISESGLQHREAAMGPLLSDNVWGIDR